MHMKNFIAPTMQDALQMVREELGENAVIFQTREVRPKGIFGPRHIEVSAARESDDENAAARPAMPAAPAAPHSPRLRRNFNVPWGRSQRPRTNAIRLRLMSL